MGDLLGGQLSELVTTREWEGNKDGNRRSHTIWTRQTFREGKLNADAMYSTQKRSKGEERQQSK